jgi:hypothetical protein
VGHCNIKIGNIIELIELDDYMPFVDQFYIIQEIILSSTVKGFDVIELDENEQTVFISKGIEQFENIAWFKEKDKNIKWKITSS